MIKVTAIQRGYFDERRIREGETFSIASPEQFSPKWMELAGKSDEIAKAKPLIEKVLQAKEENRQRAKQAKMGKLPAAAVAEINKLLAENQQLRVELEKLKGGSQAKVAKPAKK